MSSFETTPERELVGEILNGLRTEIRGLNLLDIVVATGGKTSISTIQRAGKGDVRVEVKSLAAISEGLGLPRRTLVLILEGKTAALAELPGLDEEARAYILEKMARTPAPEARRTARRKAN